MPTGASADRSPLTPDECHAALAASNPSYASLSITQKPSWVRPPSSYKPGSASSLSVAFEDPDGSKMKMLLAERYMYALGNRTVLKWKYHPKNSKGNSKSTTRKHPNTGDTDNDKDVDQLLSALVPETTPTAASFPPSETASAPPAQSSQPTCRSSRTRCPPHPLDA